MCGVTGILNLDDAPILSSLLSNMTDMLTHRGPDDKGTYINHNIGLGHTRLSIIDLTSAGHQPMLDDYGRYVISYNGEVYNFIELRSELLDLGYRFISRTDSEVVLKSISHWGLSAVKKFNGMFAFALWDNKEKLLHLFRDRFGIKPLYYYQNKRCVLFASEFKAFLAHKEFENKLDKYGLAEYLTFQNFISNKTISKNVYTVPPGSIITFNSEGSKKVEHYWDFDFSESQEKVSDKVLEDKFELLFKNAINKQLVSDVRIGSYLSGGIDSSLITAIASKKISNIDTFTVGFDLNSASGVELAFDERESAKQLSDAFQTNHHEVILKSGDMESSIRKLVWHLEEPRVGQSYPNYYATNMASKFAKVALAGTGGDELFGGYPWRYYKVASSKTFDEFISNYYSFWQRLVSQDKLNEMLTPIENSIKDFNGRELFEGIFPGESTGSLKGNNYINLAMYFESKTFLHGLLTVDDKLSMAHSLETRVPFLDNGLVNFAMSLPVSKKISNLDNFIYDDENFPLKLQRRFHQSKDGKLLLRKIIKNFVPEIVSERNKQGFSGPDASWFRGESIDYVKDLLFSKNANIYQYLDMKVVMSLLNEHFEGRENRRLLIWSLLYLENWLDIFVSNFKRSI
ncbi:asparagine synthase (glutamine-hydrolyzing) [Alphaproteobacteria bacterium]|nr:asparagine synthase (glutamine-hydrolyzing) [Alphaproteobacteria bacterium]